MQPQQPTNDMQYRFLGSSGLQVSAISYGFADARSQEDLNKLIARAYELGVNFFDCAETYGQPRGSVETLLGHALKALNVDREELVVSTKIYWGGDVNQVNRRGLSRKHLIEGAKASLKRLQLTYVDLIFAHRADDYTPLEETCRAFDWLIRHGYALYWGTSEWPARKIEEAIGICEQLRLIKPVMEQPEYSMLHRERFEKEYAGLFQDHKYGSTIWSPLAGGALTGKYAQEVPEDSRMKTSSMKQLVDKYLNEDTHRINKELKVIADELGASLSQLALAWTLRNKDVSTAIIGARKIPQLEENIASVKFVEKITKDVEKRIEDVLKNKPGTEFDWRNFKPTPSRRDL